jgi:hypothetical protein
VKQLHAAIAAIKDVINRPRLDGSGCSWHCGKLSCDERESKISDVPFCSFASTALAVLGIVVNYRAMNEKAKSVMSPFAVSSWTTCIYRWQEFYYA